MAGMAVDGLVSGFNTTQMISQLMQLEAAPQTLLKGKVTKAETFVSALQGLNTKLSSLADAAKTAATATSWQAVTATSSATSVTATATAGAQTSSLSFTVDRLASRQSSVSTAVTDLADFFEGAKPATLTLATGSRTAATVKEISLTDVNDLAGMAGAINKADAGVTATIVKVADGRSVLQLTGKATGGVGGFDLYNGTVTAAEVASSTPPTPLLGRTTVAAGGGNGPGGTVVSDAADAQITLWGTHKVPSATNTFDGVVANLSFTVSAVEADAAKPVTISVGRNDAALKKLGADLVTNISTVLSEVASRTKSTTSTVDGRPVTKGGVLSGDSTTRSVQQSVLSAASLPVGTTSPSSVGIVLGKDGTMTFDETKFSAAMAADPANVQAVVTAVAERVQKVAKDFSDPTDGSLSLKIKSQQSYVRNLSEQVSNWDTRIALRRSTLERTYSSLEVSLSNINAQASWLSSQLAQLNANTQK